MAETIKHRSVGFQVWSTEIQENVNVLKFNKGNSSNGGKYHIIFDGNSEFTFETEGMYKVEVTLDTLSMFNTLILDVDMDDKTLLLQQSDCFKFEFSGSCNYNRAITVNKDTKLRVTLGSKTTVSKNAVVLIYKIASC